MKSILLAVLVAVPASLVTWVFARGADVPCEPCDPALVCPKEGGGGGHGAGGHGVPAAVPAKPTTPDAAAKPAKPAGGDAALLAVLKPVEGFAIKGDIELFDRDGLFDYINGGAPLYLERNFRKLAAVEMGTDAGGELTCDVYDMNTEKDAAAMFLAEKQPTAKPFEVGAEGRKSTMSLVFRKGPYYVKLTAFDAGAEAALPKLAQALSGRMP